MSKIGSGLDGRSSGHRLQRYSRYVTATRNSELGFAQTTGTFWRGDTDATGGFPLIPGALTRVAG